MKGLKWMFELLDRTSGPARTIGRELSAVERQMRDLDRAARRLRLGGAPANDNALRGLRQQRRHLADLRAEVRDQAGGSGRGGWLGSLLGAGAAGPQLGAAVGVVGHTLATVGSAALDTAGAVLHYGTALAVAAVQAADFAANTRLAFRTLLQSQGVALPEATAQARGMTRRLSTYAARTPFEEATVVQQAQSVMGGGFTEAQMMPILRAAGDVSALHHGNTNFGDRLIRLINTVHGVGANGTTARRLQTLDVNGADYLDTIAARLRLGTGEAGRRAATGALRHGRVGAGMDAVNDILETIRRTRSGGALGGIQTEQAQSVSGLISTLKSLFTATFNDFDSTPGYKALQKFLSTLADLTDQSSVMGARIHDVLYTQVGGALEAVFGPLTEATVAAWIDRALAGITTIGTTVQALTPAVFAFAEGFAAAFGVSFGPLQGALTDLSDPGHAAAVENLRVQFAGLGQSLGTIAGQLAGIATHIDSLTRIGRVAWNVEALDPVGLYNALTDGPAATVQAGMYAAGTQGAAGLAQGLGAGMSEVQLAAIRLGGTAVDATAQTLQVHSPSRVFADLGRYSAEGFAQGLEGGMGRVQGAIGAMVGAPGAAAGGAGGAGASITMGDVHLHLGADAAAEGGGLDPDAVRAAVRAALEDVVAAMNAQVAA